MEEFSLKPFTLVTGPVVAPGNLDINLVDSENQLFEANWIEVNQVSGWTGAGIGYYTVELSAYGLNPGGSLTANTSGVVGITMPLRVNTNLINKPIFLGDTYRVSKITLRLDGAGGNGNTHRFLINYGYVTPYNPLRFQIR